MSDTHRSCRRSLALQFFVMSLLVVATPVARSFTTARVYLPMVARSIPTLPFLGSVGGSSGAVAVTAATGYVGEGSQLAILDLHDPRHPGLVSRLSLPGHIVDIEPAGTLVYVTTAQGVAIVDVTAPAVPHVVRQIPGTEDATGAHIVGGLLYVDGPGPLRIIDVADSTSPRILGNSTIVGQVVQVSGTIAYAATPGGFVVIDVKIPSQPSVQTAVDLSMLDHGGGRLIQVVGDRAYTFVPPCFRACEAEVKVIDISSRTRPVIIGSLPVVDVRQAQIEGTLLYVNTGYGLMILDVTQPAQIKVIGTYTHGYLVADFVVRGRNAYLTSKQGGLELVDLQDPAAPVLVGAFTTLNSGASVERLQVNNGRAYLLTGIGDPSGLALDIADVPAVGTPTILGRYASSFRARISNAVVVGSTAYILKNDDLNGVSQRLVIVDLSDPGDPKDQSFLGVDYANDLVVVDNRAYLIHPGVSGLPAWVQIVDVADPHKPQAVGRYTSDGEIWDIEVVGNVAYLLMHAVTTEDVNRLLIVDMANPAAPRLRGTYSVPYDAWTANVVVEQDRAYVAMQDGTVDVVDVRVPEHPIRILALPGTANPFWLHRLHVSGERLYLATTEAVYELDAQTLATVAMYKMGALDVQVVGNRVYIAAGNDGLQIVGVSPNP